MKMGAGEDELVMGTVVDVGVDGADDGETIAEQVLGCADVRLAEGEPIGGTTAGALEVGTGKAKSVTGIVADVGMDGADDGGSIVDRV